MKKKNTKIEPRAHPSKLRPCIYVLEVCSHKSLIHLTHYTNHTITPKSHGKSFFFFRPPFGSTRTAF